MDRGRVQGRVGGEELPAASALPGERVVGDQHRGRMVQWTESGPRVGAAPGGPVESYEVAIGDLAGGAKCDGGIGRGVANHEALAVPPQHFANLVKAGGGNGVAT